MGLILGFIIGVSATIFGAIVAGYSAFRIVAWHESRKIAKIIDPEVLEFDEYPHVARTSCWATPAKK